MILKNIHRLIEEVENSGTHQIEEKLSMRGAIGALKKIFRRTKKNQAANMSDQDIKQRNGLIFRLKMRVAREFNKPPAAKGEERFVNGVKMIDLMRSVLSHHRF